MARWLPMQGGFETRPYKTARRAIVYTGDACAPAASLFEGAMHCVARWRQGRMRRKGEAMPRPYSVGKHRAYGR